MRCIRQKSRHSFVHSLLMKFALMSHIEMKSTRARVCVFVCVCVCCLRLACRLVVVLGAFLESCDSVTGW